MRASIIRLFRHLIIAIALAHSAVLPAAADSAKDVNALNGQTGQLYKQGQYAEALKRAEMALAIAGNALGPDHPASHYC